MPYREDLHEPSLYTPDSKPLSMAAGAGAEVSGKEVHINKHFHCLGCALQPLLFPILPDGRTVLLPSALGKMHEDAPVQLRWLS